MTETTETPLTLRISSRIENLIFDWSFVANILGSFVSMVCLLGIIATKGSIF